MEMGYSFVWIADQDPYFVCPDGSIVEFEVRDNIPYLRAGSSDCAPNIGSNTQSVPCAANPALNEGEDSAEEIDSDPRGADAGSDDLIDGEEFVDENPKRDLKAEALSIKHRLHHRVTNPHCDACK